MKITYPTAPAPTPLSKPKSVATCRECGGQLVLGLWDRWNGFLVRCPHCGRLHGKSRRVRQVIMAGAMFNFVSFWFVMRPKAAALATTGVLAWAFGLGYLTLGLEGPDWAIAVWGIGLLLGPMVITAAVAVVHEAGLGKKAPALEQGKTRAS